MAIRTVSGKYRDPYRPAARFNLKPCLAAAGKATRFVSLTARESAVDWQGSYYRNQAAEFVGVEGGWRHGGRVYQTLLAAVRAALSD